ncbi:MAG: hypothetical protein Q7S14_03845 [bacterium]|nr:hypothetical protein [bacterium]
MAKTTIQIDPDVLYKAKLKALNNNMTLKRVINDSLRIGIQNIPVKANLLPAIKWGHYDLGIKGKVSREEIYADL